MALSKQDRNVGITVGLVLIVCVVSLIAIGSILIRLITPGLERIGNIVGAGVRVSAVDYNFPIPSGAPIVVVPVETEVSSQSATSQPTVVVPAKLEILPPKVRNLTQAQHAAVGKKLGLERLVSSSNNPQELLQIEAHIYIPKLGLYTPVLNTNNGQAALSYGSWLHPSSYLINQGEWGVLCERSLFQPFAANSCMFLDELTSGDVVLVIIASTAYQYKIIQPLAASTRLSEINSYSPLGKSLRIITSDLNQNQVQILIAEPTGLVTNV